MKRRTAWFLGSAAALAMALGGLSLGACSSDSTSTPLPTPKDATTSGDSSSQGGDSGSTSDAGASDSATTAEAGDAASDASCGTKANPHPRNGTPQGVYCFLADGGRRCGLNDECCAPNFVPNQSPPSTCQSRGTVCAGDIEDAGGVRVECEDDTECGAGQLCCIRLTAIELRPECPGAGQGYAFGRQVRGAYCETATACPAGSVHFCHTQDQCGDAGTCTQFRYNARDWGGCRQ